MDDTSNRAPDDLNDDELISFIHDQTKLVQMEFDSLQANGDRTSYDERIAQLDNANKIAEQRGLEVPRRA
ncbi:hypothetical protein [Williamsia muralis]|uniref:Uncharacterized protein n=1 Tax=Williamsia marianensis TaxID=85044 RepID=A0A2G3PJF1_WILMA|nr:hypothetical protein [Williamsia marianensis]PHV65947.1 hypothetical protein CSW57_19995 [Williamsia marianensis]